MDCNNVPGIWSKPVDSSRSSEEIRNRLKGMGITHIFYNVSEVKRVNLTYGSFNWANKEARERFFRFLSDKKYLRLIFFSKGVFIYKLL